MPINWISARSLPPGFAPASREGGGPVQRDGRSTPRVAGQCYSWCYSRCDSAVAV